MQDILQQAATILKRHAMSFDQYKGAIFVPSRKSPKVIFTMGESPIHFENIPSVERMIIPRQYDYGAEILEKHPSGWRYAYLTGKWAHLCIPELRCEIPLLDLYQGITMPLGA